MPDIGPVRAGDPERVDEYQIVGRLGEDVYLATAPSGDRVVVRLLPADVSPERFREAMEPLREIPAFCTAQVLDSGLDGGVDGDRPYIVSEYVDGPTLEEAVASEGVLRAASLHRIAVGTMTALVALHQAGTVHGDLRPGGVVFGPDGPRVIDLGMARALEATASSTTRKVDVPAYSSPERLMGTSPGPEGDLFSWGATMVFAASGRSPFEAETMSGTVNRIVNDEPDLGALPDDLRGPVTACLAKDPALRPTASDVLLRLVGGFLTSDQAPLDPSALSASSAPGTPSTRPLRRARPALLAAGALAVALVSGGVVYLAVSDDPAPVAAPRPARSTAQGALAPAFTPQPQLSPNVTEAPWERVEKTTEDVELPGTGITLHESPKDATKLGGYLNVKPPFASFAREKGKETFKQVANALQPVLSPQGDMVALNPFGKFTESSFDYLRILDLRNGAQFNVQTVERPLEGHNPVWSNDGSKVLLSVRDPNKEQSDGFVVVDVAARRATHVRTESVGADTFPSTFAPDGSVARGYYDGKGYGVDFYGPNGQAIRTMHWVGQPRNTGWFSPSGALFATVCPKGDTMCVWDTVSGNRRYTIEIGEKTRFVGWFNNNHLLLQNPVKKGSKIEIVDLYGKSIRVLADLKKGDTAFLSFTPAAG
ncbi:MULTISPECIES: serine/threonine protein kinase [unclassified Streptosporangium]|uniref:serine/threonine protein kinase n=1 Tax=unclassified Streptosporangium TaxID=2632669 RepID=UPI002E290316|nr:MULTISPECIES: WD40 repeat domain-containing serine/threonine protein kinase [unclassified Streptosporangium]